MISQWKPLSVIKVNVIIQLMLSDWKRTSHLSNIINKIIHFLRSELLKILLLSSVYNKKGIFYLKS